MSEPKRTPLCEEHEKLGARMVDFAGWYMPVQYEGLIQEHRAVRSAVGLFDVSHMGEIFFRGPKALESLQWLTSNDVSKLNMGEAQYSLLPNFDGGLVDDIFVYCLKKNEEYLVCVNASNIEKDFEWMKANNKGAEIVNESAAWGQIAIQGPNALELMSRVLGSGMQTLQNRNQIVAIEYQGAKCWVARTGYTGEDGVEVFVPREKTATLWNDLLKKGADLGVKPIGLGARDTLRTEMKYSLYGHEIDDHSNPFEAGLGWVVKPAKGDFVGRDAMMRAKEAGLKRKLVGFKLIDKGIPRAEYLVFSFDNQQIGKVTSGTHSPSLNEAIGIAYVDMGHSSEGSEIYIDIRGKKVKAVVSKTPFVNAK